MKEKVELLEKAYKGKKLYCLDTKMIIDWEMFVLDFIEYEQPYYKDILEYVENNILSPNGNCILIEEERA